MVSCISSLPLAVKYYMSNVSGQKLLVISVLDSLDKMIELGEGFVLSRFMSVS